MKFFKNAILVLMLLNSNVVMAQTAVQNIQDLHKSGLHPFLHYSQQLWASPNACYFSASTTNYYKEGGLWVYDGQDTFARQVDAIDDWSGGVNSILPVVDGFLTVKESSLYYFSAVPGVPRRKIGPCTIDLHPQNSIFWKGRLFYRNFEIEHGSELWVTDEKLEQSYLLKDILPGPNGANPSDFQATEHNIYFIAKDTNNHSLLYCTNETADSIFCLGKDSLELSLAQVSLIKATKERLFILFQPASGQNYELWTSDGTEFGTKRLKKFLGNTSFTLSFRMLTLGDKCLFYANDESTYNRWYVSDGTVEGTRPIVSLPESSFDTPHYDDASPYNLNGYFYFFIRPESGKYALWKTDGTEQGTSLILNLPTQIGITDFQALPANSNYIMAFIRRANNEPYFVRTDGTESGTFFIPLLQPNNNLNSLNSAVAVGDEMLFSMGYSDSLGLSRTEIFRVNAADASNKKIGTGLPTPQFEHSFPEGFVADKFDRVYFRSFHEAPNFDIWQVDGDKLLPLDTALLGNSQFKSLPVVTGDTVFWFADCDVLRSSFGLQLSTPSTIITPGALGCIMFSSTYATYKGALYYLSDDGGELRKYNGSSSIMIKKAPEKGGFKELRRIGDRLYLTYLYPFNAYKLWESNGTSSGTFAVQDLLQGTGNSLYLNNVDDRYFIEAYFPLLGINRLYIGGLQDIDCPGGNSSARVAGLEFSPEDSILFILGPRQLPTDEDPKIRFKFWRYKTQIEELKSFGSVSGYAGGYPYRDLLHSTNGGKIVFGAGENSDNTELWVSDGSISGTQMLLDINPLGSSNPDNFVQFNERFLLFTASNGQSEGWWATDGTLDGTFEIATLPQNGAPGIPANPKQAFLHKNRLYFSMNDGLIGEEPWVLELSDTLSIHSFTPVLPLSNPVSVWPNPTQGYFQFSIPELWLEREENLQYQIVDAKGHLVLNAAVAKNGTGEIRIPAGWPTGTYFFIIIESNGKCIATKRFVMVR